MRCTPPTWITKLLLVLIACSFKVIPMLTSNFRRLNHCGRYFSRKIQPFVSKRGVKFQSSSRNDVTISTKISLNPNEVQLFTMLKDFVREQNQGTIIRIAGGWVRDKLLGIPGKYDIDIALDNMTGRQFTTDLSQWIEQRGLKKVEFGIIQQNPDKSKHLETGALQTPILRAAYAYKCIRIYSMYAMSILLASTMYSL